MKKQKITVDNITYEVVGTVHDDETNHDFVVYSDCKLNNLQELKLSCVMYREENGEFIPIKITREEDKEKAKEIVVEVMNKLKYMVKENKLFRKTDK